MRSIKYKYTHSLSGASVKMLPLKKKYFWRDAARLRLQTRIETYTVSVLRQFCFLTKRIRTYDLNRYFSSSSSYISRGRACCRMSCAARLVIIWFANNCTLSKVNMNDECMKNHVENENHTKIMRKMKNALRSILSMARHGLCWLCVRVWCRVIDGRVLSVSSIRELMRRRCSLCDVIIGARRVFGNNTR